ncbi:MAG: DUF4249 domain-containing protein [Prevotellaceae bacterium]|jgi:hypothetical protein|nr:DUF4249 domain-containing protein [Prevotellaceae bacterium]
MDKNLPRKIRRRPVNLFRRAAALFLLFSSCEPTLVAEFQDVPVVEGYLYSGEPASVRISKLIPYRSDVTFSDEDVDSLRVEIADETDGATYALRSQGGGLYVDSTLLPKAGHSYRLTFAYNGVQVDALTELAAAPESVTVSPTSITVASWGEGGGGFGGGGMPSMPDPVSIAWSNPNRDYYLVVVDNTDANPVSVRDSASTASLSFLTGLTQDSIVQLSSQMFSYTGRHVVKLCRVQPEYTVMVQANSSSRSESLTEVHANVTNGFGIFTGMSAHSAVITVHK